ncbi:Nif3-like dinuclear metal center hexameric protein [Blautia glucerasea]|uniref:Nif3-like dinuclear metal center hexameric protein n=1 Tax=Blautia glucerasea TaxID=536633 RepID=UPI001D0700BA|nr:Nif3-like dinuclear metal center hexameric protein [Blautia glucerasea]MCB6368044.1 Nif3-like dinuclear metal center hexameric protein [Blautia glucerasea]
MTIQEILDRVSEYHPDLGEDYHGCDEVKFGDCSQECTGIVSALVPTVDVIRRAVELKANLLYVHEPVSYLTPDWPEWKADYKCRIYDEKLKLLKENKIVLVRDHDHMHAHKPDSIFTGVLKYLGWMEYLTEEQKIPFGYTVCFPKAKKLREINQELIEKIGMQGLRFIGNPEAELKKIAFRGHIYPDAFIPQHFNEDGSWSDYATEIIREMEQDGVECIIPGEVIEWTVLSYIRDGISLGKNLACINPGHFNWEELGARYAKDWLMELTENKVSVFYVPTGDMWKYQTKKSLFEQKSE